MELTMRKDVPTELTWDLSLIYPTEEEMYRDLEKMTALCTAMEEKYKGKLTTAEAVNACLDDYRELYRLAVLVGNYADLAVSVDYYDSHNQERNKKVSQTTTEVMSRLSFVESEIMAQRESVLRQAQEMGAEALPAPAGDGTGADGSGTDPQCALSDLQHDQAGGHSV